jgi:hypothetical protein
MIRPDSPISAMASIDSRLGVRIVPTRNKPESTKSAMVTAPCEPSSSSSAGIADSTIGYLAT